MELSRRQLLTGGLSATVLTLISPIIGATGWRMVMSYGDSTTGQTIKLEHSDGREASIFFAGEKPTWLHADWRASLSKEYCRFYKNGVRVPVNSSESEKHGPRWLVSTNLEEPTDWVLILS